MMFVNDCIALSLNLNDSRKLAPDVCGLAAAYAFGIARNHPFVDGNKRTAFLAAYVFLRLNGYELIADEVDAIHATVSLASGDLDQDGFAAWLKKNIRAI